MENYVKKMYIVLFNFHSTLSRCTEFVTGKCICIIFALFMYFDFKVGQNLTAKSTFEIRYNRGRIKYKSIVTKSKLFVKLISREKKLTLLLIFTINPSGRNEMMMSIDHEKNN